MTVSISQQCVWLIILAAILLQTIAVAISFIYFNNVLSTMQESFSRSSVSCLMKTDFLRSAGGDRDPGEEEGKTDPCWQVTQQLHYRIEKTMAEHVQREISTAVRNKVSAVTQEIRGTSLPEVAAHVTGSVSSREDTEESGSSSRRGFLGERIRAWEGQRGLSFLLNIELRGGELEVSRGGLYYIYAQIYFRLTPIGETEGETVEEGTQLVQYIYKKMSSYPVPILLMKSTRSACWSPSQEPGLFSLHQAGTARLQPTDRLFVTVSNASVVEADGRASYFGAFLVG